MARLAQVGDEHHNLPPDSTQLVGRDKDVANLCHVVLESEGRLVTLTGVGGCGKSRLALRVASSMIGSFKDGVWLVSLAPLVDPQLVPHAVASVLGVRADLIERCSMQSWRTWPAVRRFWCWTTASTWSRYALRWRTRSCKGAQACDYWRPVASRCTYQASGPGAYPR